MEEDYELLDSGGGRKFERFGGVTLVRPCSQALWRPAKPSSWNRATASFDREDGNRWHGRTALPKDWTITTAGMRFKLSGTDFGHLGIFPEQRTQWKWIRDMIGSRLATDGDSSDSRSSSDSRNHDNKALVSDSCRVLNLFAYSGGSTIAAAQGGAEVCHVDAAKGMVQWARDNAALNGLTDHPIRWIVDDVHKFLGRELRRERRYDAVILDPPTFGRGAKGEMYKIENDLQETLRLVKEVLSGKPLFVLFTSHTPGLSCHVAENVLGQFFPTAKLESGEMLLEGRELSCPSGIFCRAVF